MTNEVIELKLPAKTDYIGVVRLFIAGVANRWGFSFDDIEDMKVAVAEACTNAVKHAYDDDDMENAKIMLSCVRHVDRIEIFVVDHGKSFDIDEIRACVGPLDQQVPVAQLNEGGLGLYLIETLMDQVEIQNENGITIMMTKFKNGDDLIHDDQPFQTVSP